MLKKEFTQFFRNKGGVFMLFIFPIILITTLSVGLKSIINGNSDIFDNKGEDSLVYYTLEEGSEKYSTGFLKFKDELEDAVSIKFEEVSSLDEVKEKVDNYDAVAFFDVKDDRFSMYSSNKGEKINGKVLKSIFQTVLDEYAVYDTVMEYNPQDISNIVRSEYDKYVTSDDVGSVRNITSTEFYTFAELALIILYVSTAICESTRKENYLNTINRIKLSQSSEHLILLVKVTKGFIISLMQTFIIYVYSSLCLNLDWGKDTFKLFIMFAAFGLFSSTLGVVVGIFSKKDTTSSGILNAINLFICFLGGCYVPLTVVLSIPFVNKLVYISPIYWIDTAVSSSLCNIESNAYTIAVLIPLVLSFVMICTYLIFVRRKGGFAHD